MPIFESNNQFFVNKPENIFKFYLIINFTESRVSVAQENSKGNGKNRQLPRVKKISFDLSLQWSDCLCCKLTTKSKWGITDDLSGPLHSLVFDLLMSYFKSLDEIPYRKMPKWGQTARFFSLINKKQKLGLDVKQRKSKNGKIRQVK